MNRPVFTIVAGSNGCGKTSLTTMARTKLQQVPLLDPDALARSLRDVSQVPISDLEAGRHILQDAEELLRDRQSLTVETTLSGGTYLRMAARAKHAGYHVMAYFIGTDAVEINLERIRGRVRKGGHDVAETDQRRRYPRTLDNREKLLPLLDLVIMYDNSTDQGHRLVAAGQPRQLRWFEPVPRWAQRFRNEDTAVSA